MPIEVDTSEAPAFLRYRYTGPFAPVEEQARVRERLIADGHLTADTIALMDARDLETTVVTAAFIDEREALAWLRGDV